MNQLARARLKYTLNLEPHVLELEKPTVLIGRNTSCDLVIPAQEVSRVHCAIERESDVWYVVDKGSRNGTFLNGEPVERQILKNTDTIAFDPNARNTVVFEDGPSAKDTGLYEDSEADISNSIIAVSLNVTDIEKSLVMPQETPSGGAPVRPPSSMISPDGRTAIPEPTGTPIVALFSQMGQALLISEDLDSMLIKVLDLVFDNLPAQRGCIYLYDESTDSLTEKATRKEDDKDPIKISRSIVNEVVKARKALLIRDAMGDERFSAAMSIVQYQIRSAMCAPMYASGEVCGLIYVDIQGDLLAFSQHDLELLTALAVFAAAGIEQARLRANVERERHMRTRLARYSSPNVVERIVTGDVDVDGEMIVEEREVTVVFADLQGFTSMSENMSPPEIARVLNGIFAKLTEIIFRFEGTLDKFIGDAVMGIFGAPLTLPDHATLAVEAALAMQDSLEELNQQELYDVPIKMRIGVNSGSVVAGDLGSPERKDYTVLGDTVNVASRLESSIASAGQVVVGPQTYELTRKTFEYEPLEEIQLKGKTKSVLPYLLTGRVTADDE